MFSTRKCHLNFVPRAPIEPKRNGLPRIRGSENNIETILKCRCPIPFKAFASFFCIMPFLYDYSQCCLSIDGDYHLMYDHLRRFMRHWFRLIMYHNGLLFFSYSKTWKMSCLSESLMAFSVFFRYRLQPF